MKSEPLPTAFLLMAVGNYQTSQSTGGRPFAFTPARVLECVAAGRRVRFVIRTASLFSADMDSDGSASLFGLGGGSSFSTASLGDCLIEATEAGLGACDVRWFAKRSEVLRSGSHPSCGVRLEPDGAIVTDVFMTRRPLLGADDSGMRIAASLPLVPRSDGRA